jgi:ABC-type multidrug transport system fused ATPase/permease subunit
MNASGHNYSRHTLEELTHETSHLDCSKHPERAKSLQIELLTRLEAATAKASISNEIAAVAEGAKFSELTPSAARTFFWPFFGFSFLITFVYGFLVGFVAALIGGVVVYYQQRSGEPASDPTQLIQLAIFLVLAVPFMTFWLRQVTKRSFGGYSLRILKTRADVA